MSSITVKWPHSRQQRIGPGLAQPNQFSTISHQRPPFAWQHFIQHPQCPMNAFRKLSALPWSESVVSRLEIFQGFIHAVVFPLARSIEFNMNLTKPRHSSSGHYRLTVPFNRMEETARENLAWFILCEERLGWAQGDGSSASSEIREHCCDLTYPSHLCWTGHRGEN